MKYIKRMTTILIFAIFIILIHKNVSLSYGEFITNEVSGENGLIGSSNYHNTNWICINGQANASNSANTGIYGVVDVYPDRVIQNGVTEITSDRYPLQVKAWTMIAEAWLRWGDTSNRPTGIDRVGFATYAFHRANWEALGVSTAEDGRGGALAVCQNYTNINGESAYTNKITNWQNESFSIDGYHVRIMISAPRWMG